MMTYGRQLASLGAGREQSRPFIKRAARARHQLLRHRRHVFARRQRRSHRPRAQGLHAAAIRCVIATKVYYPTRATGPTIGGLSRKHIFDAIDASLRRLGTDYVDLYQIHRFDYDTPIEETLAALHDVVKAGKARYIGASSMFAWQFATDARRVAAARLDPVRVHAEPLQPGVSRGRARDASALPRPGRRRHPLEPAGARIPGRQPQQGGQGRHLASQDRRACAPAVLRRLGLHRRRIGSASSRRRRGVKPTQIALAWILSKPAVTAPIVGASKIEHLDDHVGALAIRLEPDEVALLEAPYQPHRVLGHT